MAAWLSVATQEPTRSKGSKASRLARGAAQRISGWAWRSGSRREDGATLCGGFCCVSFTSCWLSAALWFLTCLPCGLGKSWGRFLCDHPLSELPSTPSVCPRRRAVHPSEVSSEAGTALFILNSSVGLRLSQFCLYFCLTLLFHFHSGPHGTVERQKFVLAWTLTAVWSWSRDS